MTGGAQQRDRPGDPTTQHSAPAAQPAAAAPLGSRLLRRLVALYPAQWRRRYGTEFEALLAATPATPRAVLDVLVAAVDAHLNPTAPLRRWPLMTERLRNAELALLTGWVVFVIGGIGFQRMTEYQAFTSAAGDHLGIGVAFDVVVVGAVVGLLGVIAAGLPIALAIARSALRERRWRQLALLAVPVVSAATWLGITGLLLQVPDSAVSDGFRVAVFALWVGAFLVAAVASTVAVSVAAMNAPVDAGLYRRAVAPAVVVAVSMAVVVAAVVAWGLLLLLAVPDLFWSDEGVLSSSTALTWAAVVVLMAAGTAIAVRSATVARRQLRV